MSDLADGHSAASIYRAPVPEPSRPDRTLGAIALLAVISLAGAWALLPSFEEKAAGLYEDGRYDDAIAMLVSAEDGRFLNAYESYMLFKLYMLTEQPKSAAALLEQQPALQPETPWALRQLSDLYRTGRNLVAEASVLRQLHDLAPSEANFKRLRILYRLTGDVAGETSLLAQSIANGDTSPAYVERLAYLRTLPQSGGPSVVWVAPTGNFSEFEPVSDQILVLSNIDSASTTSVE